MGEKRRFFRVRRKQAHFWSGPLLAKRAALRKELGSCDWRSIPVAKAAGLFSGVFVSIAPKHVRCFWPLESEKKSVPVFESDELSGRKRSRKKASCLERRNWQEPVRRSKRAKLQSGDERSEKRKKAMSIEFGTMECVFLNTHFSPLLSTDSITLGEQIRCRGNIGASHLAALPLSKAKCWYFWERKSRI